VNDSSVVLVNGRVRTFDAEDTEAEAVYIERGVIAAVGSTDEVRKRAADGVPEIDLAGRVALPGLIDAHAHVELCTLTDHFWTIVRDCDVATTMTRLEETIEKAPPGAWVVGQGQINQEMPTRAQLDEIAPHNPVLVRQTIHMLQANSMALHMAGIDRTYVGSPDVRVLRDADGEPTGLIEEGFDLFPVPGPTEEELSRAFAAEVHDRWVRYGVTTIHELPASSTGTRSWQRLHREDDLPCRMVLNPILAPGHQATVDSVDGFAKLGLQTGFGNHWLRLGGLKVFLDGNGDAALHQCELCGPPREWGLQNFLYRDIVRVLARAREAGVQVWMHAMGDAAQAMAMDAIDEINLLFGPSDHRTRIEHFGLSVTDWGTLDRLKASGTIPIPTAAFMFNVTDERAQATPEDGTRLYPYKSLIEAGLRPPGNSDTGGGKPFATNPWHGIWLMHTRQNRNGLPLSRDEVISVETAFRSYTADGAYAGFDEHLKGSIEVGKLGDVAVFAQDPLAVAPEDIRKVEADLTIIGGRTMWDRSQEVN
jgi:predicted amidohydrolase YtcJ